MPKFLPCLLLLAALCLPYKSASQITKRPTLPDSSVCIPAAAARRIDATLRRYPVVLKENKHLRTAVRGYEYVVLRDSVALSAQDTVISATERRLTVAKVLGRDAENRAAQWHRKASKRGWANAALAVLVVLITLVSVR